MAVKKRRRARRKQAPGWVWMLFGLGLGLVIALGIYLRAADPRPETPQPAAARPEPATRPEPRASEPAAAETGEQAETVDADVEAPGSRFDFYDMLPQFEVVIPEAEPGSRSGARGAASTATDPPRPVEEPGSYVLQVGSFSQLADADRLKASLALLGIESRIQRVAIDGGTYHRVRIGPIDDLAEVNGIRQRLREARVETLVLKAPP